MCVGFPGKIESFQEDGTALIQVGGIQRIAYLDLLDEEIQIGDYVISHAGFAICKLDREEAEKRLELLDQLIEATDGIH